MIYIKTVEESPYMSNTAMELTYKGSVKNVFRDRQNPNMNYFAYTDDYSVFDWGKMPDQIANKGKALSILGGTFFQQLCQAASWSGLPAEKSLQIFRRDFLDVMFSGETFGQLKQKGLNHHFLGWVDKNTNPLEPGQFPSLETAPLMKVNSLDVSRPKPFTVDQSTLYQYDTPSTASGRPFLIPLEVIFRFGMPEGSSLEKRLARNPHYYAELGLSEAPRQNTWFERPVIEFFTKLEPTDRFLPLQEAFLISGLTEAQFKNLYETTVLLSLWLFNTFAKKGIELWDGKFEFAWSPEGLMLVDSIGPDELRLKYKGVHLSKEVIRQFYRGSAWELAVKEAQARAKSQPGTDWKVLCIEQLGETPKPLSAEEKRLVDNLYATLVNYCLDSSVVPATMTFDEVVSALKQEQPVGAR
jgi:phosphoribosylaminoimidazole-succinocarboxamide synthase